MIYLILAIIFTSSLILLFRVFEKFKVHIPHAIVVNYFVASSVGIINYEGTISFAGITSQPWVPVACCLGLLFISIFNLIAVTTRKMGVSVATVANKMSVIIPVITAIYLYNQQVNALKVLGILTALLAVYFTSVKKDDGSAGSKVNYKYFFLPLIVFLGSGVIDLLIDYAERNYLSGRPADLFLSSAFAVAGITGLIVVLYQVLIKKAKFEGKSIIAGIVLGIPNYLSIYCLVKALGAGLFESSVLFPITNIGIVLFSVIFAYIFFKERLSTLNKIGIAMAVGAILLIMFATPRKEKQDVPAQESPAATVK